MFDKTDIFTRLQNGETVEEIAAAMTETLNAANKEYIDAEAKRKEEETKRAEADRVYVAKVLAVERIIEGLCDFLTAAGEEDYIPEVKEINPDKMVNLLDDSINMAKRLEGYAESPFMNPSIWFSNFWN